MATIGGVLAAGLAGCGSAGKGNQGASGATTTAVAATTTTADGAPAGNDGGPQGDSTEDPKVAANKRAEDAVKDVEAYWGRTMQDTFGIDYKKISGGFFPYTPTSEQPPCGNPPPKFADIANNAFYCPSDDLIAWDADGLIPSLFDKFGGFTIGVVFAHEWGHAIQARAGITGPTVLLEQQADCFAGAWVADAQAGNDPNFKVAPADLDDALAGFLTLRDSPGTLATDAQAHGSGFDRVNAFQDGIENGPKKCKTYKAENLQLVELPFNSQADANANGNAPFQDVEKLTLDDLDAFWKATMPKAFGKPFVAPAVKPYDPEGDLPSCGGEAPQRRDYRRTAFYCQSDDFVGWDEAKFFPSLYKRFGDFAVSTIIATQYSHAVVGKAGVKKATLKANLQADCLTGVWAASTVPGVDKIGTLEISPGDLDEALTAFLVYGKTPEGLDREGAAFHGTAFQRVAAFRSGFVNGIATCPTVGG